MGQTVYTESPERIPEIIRAARASGAAGLDIVIKGGAHFLEKGISIGSPGIPVRIAAEEGARLIGGQRLETARPVDDKTSAIRFPRARAAVYACPLPRTPAPFSSRGFSRQTAPSHSEAFYNGEALTLAQYPRHGRYLQITGFPEGRKNEWGEENGDLKAGFFYSDERPKTWVKSDDILVFGYWCYDWANSCELVDILDAEKGFVKTLPPYGNYQFRKNQRFSFYNVAEELSEPGDYYIDRADNNLYFIPPDGKAGGELIVSFLTEPALSLENASDVTLENLSFEACCGHAVRVKGGENIKISNCVFKNIGNYAVSAEDTRRLKISGCDIRDTGDGGIEVSAGDRAGLSSGETVITNNHLCRIAKWSRTYVCPVNASGVGFEISHNLIHDCPHSAILFWGNEIKIENNEIYSVLQETGDAGAIYTGRDFTFRGNAVCGNYIHHLCGGKNGGTMAVYNDDCVSGTAMERNVFFEVCRAAFLGGGVDFIVKNNLFVSCYPAVQADGRGASEHPVWRDMVTALMRDRFYHIKGKSGEGSGDKSPYIDAYPELSKIDALYRESDTPVFRPDGVIAGNLFCSERKIEYSWETDGEGFVETDNSDVKPEDFTDFDFGVFDLKDPPEKGPVPLSETGLTREKRRIPVPHVLSSLKAADGEIVLSLKNLSDYPVKGKALLYDENSTLPLGLPGAAFSLEARGSQSCRLCSPDELLALYPDKDSEISVEARSHTCGVRPCRLHIRRN